MKGGEEMAGGADMKKYALYVGRDNCNWMG